MERNSAYLFSGFLVILLLWSCHQEIKKTVISEPNKHSIAVDNKDSTTTDSVAGDLIIPGFIKKEVEANHSKLINIKGNFNSFKKYLKSMDTDDIASISYALDYINTCLPKSDTTNRDSVFFYFRKAVISIVNGGGDSIDRQYESIMFSILGDSTPNIDGLNDNLAACGMDIGISEGMGYVEVTPDFFFKNFKDRVTSDVKDFLILDKYDDSIGFQDDGELVMPFDSLYQRVKRWENYANKYPKAFMKEDAQGNYDLYLFTLIVGTDNSLVSGEGDTLYPEIKNLYKRIIKDSPESRTGKIISAYYQFLAQHNFIVGEDTIATFLQTNNIRNPYK